MTVPFRILDDGAWISIDNARQVSVSDIYPLVRESFCGCDTSYFLLEGFYNVSVGGRSGDVVSAGVVGQCVDCGTDVTFEDFPVGRMVDGSFHPFDIGGVTYVREPPSGATEDAAEA